MLFTCQVTFVMLYLPLVSFVFNFKAQFVAVHSSLHWKAPVNEIMPLFKMSVIVSWIGELKTWSQGHEPLSTLVVPVCNVQYQEVTKILVIILFSQFTTLSSVLIFVFSGSKCYSSLMKMKTLPEYRLSLKSPLNSATRHGNMFQLHQGNMF